jgi:hypothetical protein
MKSYETARQVDAYPQSGNYLASNQDPGFARVLLDQSVELFLAGEPVASRLILRDLITLTLGFETLAVLTHRSVRSLRAMMSCNGRPGMDGLSVIFRAIRDWLRVSLRVQIQTLESK